MAYSPPGSSVHGISQTRKLGGLPFPSPGDLPDPGIEPTSRTLAGRFFITEPPEKPNLKLSQSKNFDGKGGKNKTYFLTHRADPHYDKTTEKEVSKNEEQSISTSIGKVFFFCCTVYFTYIQLWFFMDFLRENSLDFKKNFYLTIYNSVSNYLIF